VKRNGAHVRLSPAFQISYTATPFQRVDREHPGRSEERSPPRWQRQKLAYVRFRGCCTLPVTARRTVQIHCVVGEPHGLKLIDRMMSRCACREPWVFTLEALQVGFSGEDSRWTVQMPGLYRMNGGDGRPNLPPHGTSG